MSITRLEHHDGAQDHEQSREIIEQWKHDGVYPYIEESTNPVGRAEQNVFNICAVSIYRQLPSFPSGDKRSRRLAIQLPRQALETNPNSLLIILQEVLDLALAEQRDFVRLLVKTKLSSIIKASKVVADRLMFIGSLEQLVFEPQFKKNLLEQSQLHRILVNELWVFGDQYALGTDDQSLKAVLKKHIEILGRGDITEHMTSNPVIPEIPELMLYGRFAERIQGQYEHLVVELKRPSVTISSRETGQIRDYAHRVAGDPRFDKGQTKWKFVIVSSELDESTEAECQQSDRAYGHIVKLPYLDVFVWKWATVIQDCKWRHEFYRRELQFDVQEEDSLRYLQEMHSKFIPTNTISDRNAAL